MDNITNWNQVGGLDTIINPYTRNVNSGSQELMESLVMQDLQMPDHPDMVLQGMMGPINAISYDKNGLGYTVYYFEQFMAPNDSLKLLGVNDIIPNYSTLKSKQYEYTTEVYSVIRSDLSISSTANQLHRWLQTNEGRKIIEESGYIPFQ
jgi:phosphate transport system substrate-binding protein